MLAAISSIERPVTTLDGSASVTGSSSTPRSNSSCSLIHSQLGFVSFAEVADASSGPGDFIAHADFTDEIAENNPDWKLDLNDEVIGSWRGEAGNRADITLVWGVPMIPGGAIVTAELANLAVDQCALVEERFTLLSADNYRGDYLDIKLWDGNGSELASEPLWVDDDDEDESDDSAQAADDESDGVSDGESDGDGPN